MAGATAGQPPLWYIDRWPCLTVAGDAVGQSPPSRCVVAGPRLRWLQHRHVLLPCTFPTKPPLELRKIWFCGMASLTPPPLGLYQRYPRDQLNSNFNQGIQISKFGIISVPHKLEPTCSGPFVPRPQPPGSRGGLCQVDRAQPATDPSPTPHIHARTHLLTNPHTSTASHVHTHATPPLLNTLTHTLQHVLAAWTLLSPPLPGPCSS